MGPGDEGIGDIHGLNPSVLTDGRGRRGSSQRFYMETFKVPSPWWAPNQLKTRILGHEQYWLYCYITKMAKKDNMP